VLDFVGDLYIDYTTGASSYTLTLPTLADNLASRLYVTKVDSGAGVVTIDGEGAETIVGNATIALSSQYTNAVIRGGSSTWALEVYHDYGASGGDAWVRRADGTQECYGYVAIQTSSVSNNNIGTYGWTFYYATSSITFAKAFTARPTVITSGSDDATTSHIACTARSITTAGFTLMAVHSSDSDKDCGYRAIGRWY
jgi:hypothetical protein